MIRNWLIYILTVAALLVFTVMYGRQSGFLLFLLALILPILYAGITWFYSRNIDVVFESEPDLQDKKMSWKLQFQSITPFLEGRRGRLVYQIQTRQGKLCEEQVRNFYLKKEDSMVIQYETQYAGLYELRIKKIRLYSSFSLLSRVIRSDLRERFFVMPEYNEEFACIDRLPMQTEGESDTFLSHKEGSDPTEILGFRDYHPGDKSNRINWKVTVKTGRFMVPQYGFPIACDIGIMIDAAHLDEKSVGWILEILYSLFIQLTSRRRMCYVMWENDRSGLLVRKTMKKEEDIYETLYAVADTVNEHSICLEELYEQQYEGEYFSQVYYICQREEKMWPDEIAAKLHAENLEMIEL